MSESLMILKDKEEEEITAIRMRTGVFYRVAHSRDKEMINALACRIEDKWIVMWCLNGGRKNFIHSPIEVIDRFDCVFVEVASVFLYT